MHNPFSNSGNTDKTLHNLFTKSVTDINLNEQNNFYTNQVTQTMVASLSMIQTGTYNQMYGRPYDLHITQEDLNKISNRLGEVGQGRVSGNILAGIASNIIQPRATPESLLNVPNGWNEPRIRFVLEVVCNFSLGGKQTYYFQGYTDSLGVMLGRNNEIVIDPKMVFIINSVQTVNYVATPTINGVTQVSFVSDNVHLLVDNNWYSNLDKNGMYLLRPQDVFSQMQLSNIRKTRNIIDPRDRVTNTAVSSTRNNNIPSTYLAKIIDGHMLAKDQASLTSSISSITDQARSFVLEESLISNPFLRLLSDIKGFTFTDNSFTYNNLLAIDSNVPYVSRFYPLSRSDLTKIHSAGSSAYWDATDLETVIATVLSQAVPAIMIECMLHKVYLYSTNMSMGIPDTKLSQGVSISGIDLTKSYNNFIHRFNNELIKYLTYDNEISYYIEMSVDLNGETSIIIKLNQNPEIKYVSPSFCDNQLIPVMTTSPELISTVSSGIEDMLNSTSETVYGNQIITNHKFRY